MLKCFWLGIPLLQENNRSIKLETRKATALLAYLSMTHLESSREFLATLFWPEFDQAHALANLRRTLSSLLADLPPGTLKTNRDTIHWKDPATRWVDAEEFLRAPQKVTAHCNGDLCAQCFQVLEHAAALYRGEFLESLNLKDTPGFDEWQIRHRRGIQQVYGDILERLAVQYARRDQADLAITTAQRWVALDRMHEPAQRCLIRFLLQSERRSEARRQYEELSLLLKEQIGQEPERETQLLHNQIMGSQGSNREGQASTVDSTSTLPLLKSKLYIPSPPERLVKRHQLVRLLEHIPENALTLISAPAGFGKTTLLAEWVSQIQTPVAWLSLDRGDNDPYRFISYLIAALESANDEVKPDTRQMMQSMPGIPPDVILASLLNDLGSLSEPCVLVLDDYHLITERAVHETMTYLLDHLPANLHTVIASRSDPPLQLGRMRAYNQMLELRTSNLRFTPEEAFEFINTAMQLDLAESDIEILEARTEGWVVGLQMAALSLRGHKHSAEFIRAFSGSHRFVLDYLAEEVLGVQSEEIQQFLLKTSILGQLNGFVCDFITGRTDSHQVLEKLERENLFLTVIDEEQPWYRYHQLFAGLLANRLNQYLPEVEIQDLHRRAGFWFAGNNHTDQAMHHALLSDEYDLAIEIIEKNALLMIGKGETLTMMRWISSLPEKLMNERLLLMRVKIWGLGFAGKIDQAAPLFPKVDEILKDSKPSFETQAIRGEIALFRGVHANYHCQFKEAADHIQEALSLIPETSTRIRAVGVFALGDIFRAQGYLERSIEEFIKAGRLAQEFGEFRSQIQSLWSQAIVYEIQGRLHQAENLYRQAYTIASEHGLQSGSVIMIDVGLSGLYYQWNQLEQARLLLSGRFENIAWQSTMHWWENPCMIVPGYLNLARLLRISGERDGAKTAIEKAIRLCEEFDVYPDLCDQVRAEHVRSWLEQGELNMAEQWLEKLDSVEREPIEFWHEYEEMAAIRVLLALGRFVEGHRRVTRLITSAHEGGRIHHLIEMLVLQALSLEAAGKLDEALESLGKAVELAQPEEFKRVFLDEGARVKDLLLQGKQGDTWLESRAVAYIDKLIDSFGG